MTIQISGADNVLRSIKRKMDRQPDHVIMALDSVLAEMVNYIKQNGPWKDRTSNLRNSINYSPAKKRGDVISGVIYAGAEYAIFVEFKQGYWVISGAITEYKDRILSLIAQRLKSL